MNSGKQPMDYLSRGFFSSLFYPFDETSECQLWTLGADEPARRDYRLKFKLFALVPCHQSFFLHLSPERRGLHGPINSKVYQNGVGTLH